MKVRRFPIALRLFLTVLMTTVVITTVSLGVFQWAMKQNFTKYVADVEIQKLDHLVENLAGIYSIYNDWGDAIQAQILQVEGKPQAQDFDQLSRMWLRRQYDIAYQQRYFKDNAILNVPNGLDARERSTQKRHFTEQQIQQMEENLPSEYQPFEGIKFPLSESLKAFSKRDRPDPPPFSTDKAMANDNNMSDGGFSPNDGGLTSSKTKNLEISRNFFPMPDHLGLSNRLALYDTNKHFVVGEPQQVNPTYRPILLENQVVGYLGLQPSLAQDDVLSVNFFSSQKKVLFLIYIVTFFTSLLIALWLANYFKQPIQRLLNAAQELTKGHFQHQVKIRRNDELGDLSTQINGLANILNQHEQSRRQWVADTSHELKTPLAVLQAQIEAIQDGIRKPTPEHFAAMMKQVSSLKKLTQDLADLAQAESQQLKCYLTEVDPWKVVCDEIENFRTQFEQSEFQVTSTGTGASLLIDQDRFRQVVVNILSNSIRYSEKGGQIHIHSKQTHDDWTLIVDDSPLGLTDTQLKHLGERFYRADDSRARTTGGTGLGLALSYKIIAMLGGELTFHHSPLGGLRCVIRFLKK
ncbi:sensor histidine kinase efflux regulator BaeS [Acinetobacter rathckeae]|uniref:sensor histidine kinase efflux regulator BaeS n=1 Tax=Acinetobacter rathckeae TaxID=2605272 RepID=UPI0018A2C918|nr:sensor histidine kinase efflux regulator BaeS [Acinetobacter rathckeae]MBF7687768.1 sensor histidine kinase efflux regulator BaeS [Acinetobacter rathckeae]MBF7688009.1 sensor histidine kinase efflux regulator BaeS [Acinetobacter rathckeae]MBF7695937.1 sensor histidine kinase efflux regulator BaeS [Acinetobacter rathckeae]